MNRITLQKLRLALRCRVAVKSSIGGGWFIDKPVFSARPAVQS